MSDPPDPGTGFLFRRAVLLELDRLLQEFPKRWSAATVLAVLASKLVDVEHLFDLLDRVEVAIVAIPRPPDSG
jgi:hypothetical protein